MPLLYDNSSASISEAELPFDAPRDWTQYGIQSLSVWIHGDMSNSAEPFYVALQHTIRSRIMPTM